MHISRRAFLGASALAPLSLPAAVQAQTFSRGFSRERAIAEFSVAAEEQARQIAGTRLSQSRPDTTADQNVRSVETVARILSGRAGYVYPDGTAVLFYHRHGSGRLRSWLIGSEGLLAAAEQDAGRGFYRLDQAALDLRSGLQVDGPGFSRAPIFRSGNPARFNSESASLDVTDLPRATLELATLLLPPQIREGLAGVKHLSVIGSGAIQTVPIAMLPLESGQLVIDRMTVTSTGSLAELASEIPAWSWPEAYAQPLIFGDPEVPYDPFAVSVPPLPGAREEAATLSSICRKEAQLGPDATKALFLQRWRSASTLYVAAHGVADANDPLERGMLLLSGETPHTAYLTAREVLPIGFPIVPPPEERIEAKLVVLSACQSGLGRVMNSGVIGMARAFNQRGAPRVVMSLWSVSDESSLALMNEFNRACVTARPAVALRAAILNTRQTFSHPRHWAPFVMFGTPR